MSSAARQCSHTNARLIETDEEDDGEFYEVYRCPCGARGRVEGNTNDPAQRWDRTGEVFRDG